MIKNLLTDLQNHLFEMIECLNDNTLTGSELEQEVRRALAINELAKTAITNGALMVKCADILYGLPVSDALPLIPPSPAETPKILTGKKKALIEIPKGKGK
jgi:hypothetical protein